MQEDLHRRAFLKYSGGTALGVLASPTHAQVNESKANATSVRIAYAALGGGSAPLWTAQDAGILARNGLDADVTMIRGSGVVTKALISGEAQFGNIASPAPLKATLLKQGELVYLTGGLNYMVQTLVTLPEIETPSQLKGQLFGKATGGEGQDDLVLEHIGARLGLDPKADLRYVEIKNQPDAIQKLQRKEIVAAFLTPPWLFVATRAGFRILLDPMDALIDYQLGGIVTTKAQLAANPDLVRKVVKSYVEGVHHFRRNPEFVVALLKKYSAINDPDVAMQCYQQYCKFFTPRPYPTVKGIQAVLNLLAREVPQAANADPEQFIDRRWLKELDDSGFIEDLYKREPDGL